MPTGEITASERTVNDVLVRKSVGAVSFVIRSGPRKTIAKAADAVSSVVDSSNDFPKPASDILIAENEVVEEDWPWNLSDLTLKDDH